MDCQVILKCHGCSKGQIRWKCRYCKTSFCGSCKLTHGENTGSLKHRVVALTEDEISNLIDPNRIIDGSEKREQRLKITDVKVLCVSMMYVLLAVMPTCLATGTRLKMYTSTIRQLTGIKVDPTVVCLGFGAVGVSSAFILSYGYFRRRAIFIKGVGIVMMAHILLYLLSGFVVEPLLILILYPFAYYAYKKTNQYKLTPFGNLKFKSQIEKHD
ncbi:uncharacterized protein [Mytilus edulis]|uniref:uncharacterized protein n=1 Tax=Mytilus edulis TaxID=6550 RepID=UPI0039EF1C1D